MWTTCLDRVLRHRDAIISHLNWVCSFLGFHSFGLYCHNDTMRALGRPQDMFSDTGIQLQPIFAQWVQQDLHAAGGGLGLRLPILLAGVSQALCLWRCGCRWRQGGHDAHSPGHR
jgi:photosystem I P700 chlorophyll a apoprotein A1